MMLQLESTSSRVVRWTLAISLVVAIHGGALAWAFRAEPVDDWESQTGGAFIVELSAITASPDEETRDIAVGEKSYEVAAVAGSAPQVASVAEPEPDEKPLAPETKEPPPEDALVLRPEKPPEDEPKPEEQTAAQAKDAPSVAPVEAREAAAPQKIESATETSDKPKGQNVGFSTFDRAAIQNWQKDLIVHINRSKRYPEKARDARQHGVVTVAFAMDREGKVMRTAIVKGSGHDALDQAAMEMLHRANPLPIPPAAMAGEMFEFAVPVRFRWRD